MIYALFESGNFLEGPRIDDIGEDADSCNCSLFCRSGSAADMVRLAWTA
jgi:hypothetical protein